MTDPSHPRLERLLGAVSAGLAVATLLVGCVVLVGWLFDLPVLRQLRPDLISMKAITAAAFVLTGLSLWLSQAKRARVPAFRYGAWASAAVVAALGALTLAEYALGWNLGLDQLLFTEPAGTAQTVYPGRMAPNTALNFLLLGLGLLLLDVQTRRGQRPAYYLIGLGGFIALVALVGYLYGTSALYSLSAGVNPMSLPAALAGALAFLGLWLARPGPGLVALLAGDSAGGQVARHFLLPALLFPLLLDVVLLAGRRAGLYGEQVGAAAHVVAMTALLLWLVLAAAAALSRAETELAALRGAPPGPFPPASAPAGQPSGPAGALAPRWGRYVGALAFVAAAVILRLGLLPSLGMRNVYVTFYPAVILAALYGGLSAGLVATVVSAFVTDYFLIAPLGFGIADPADWLGLAMFLFGGTMISGVTEVMHRARARAHAAETEARLAAARQQDMERLRQQREWLRVTLSSIGDAVVVADTAGRITFLNPVAAALTGWDEPAALGQPVQSVFRIINEETRLPGEDIVVRVLREGCAVALANRTALVRRDGREVPIEDSAALIKDSSTGTVSGVVLVFHDVTQKRRAEQTLRESEERLTFALETSHTGAWELDLRDHTARRSREHDRIFGYPALLPQWTYEMFLEHVLPEDRPVADGQFRRAVETGGDWNFECRIRRPDQQVRWIWAVGRHRADAAGVRQRMMGIIQDITERKRAEELQARLAAIVQSSDDAILSKDLGGLITSWNAGAERLFGYPSQEVIGRSVRLLLPPERQDEEDQIMARLQAGERVEHFETVRLTKAGRSLAVSVTSSPLRDVGGRIIGASKIVRDITERQQAAEAMQQLNAELRQRVAELQAANEAVQTSRRAAMSLAEDALEARQAAERVSADLQKANDELEVSRQAALNLMDDAVQARIEAEQAGADSHRAAEQRRLALEAADLGAWEYQFQTGAVFWDERCREMWGLPQHEQIEYARAVAAIHPEDRAGVDEAVKQALAGKSGGAYHREFRVVWPDGSVRWIASHGRVYFQGEGGERHAIRFIGANVDVTWEKQAEQALRESEQRFRTMANAMPQLAWIARGDGHIYWYNQGWYDYTGTTPEQMEGWGWQSVHDPAVLPKVLERWRASLAAGQPLEMEFPLRGADGRFRPFLTRGVPLKDAEGRVVQWLGTNTDITEQKQAEEELQRLNRILKARSQSDQALVRATVETEYLEAVCRIVVEDCGHAMVWVGFAGEDEDKIVRPAAQAGFEEGYLETLRITWADTERGRGPTGTAIRTGQPSLCRNMLTDPRFAPWRQQAIQRGYASSLALPLLADARAFGALTIYSREPDGFSEDEVRLLGELAGDLAFGIAALRLRTAKAQAEAELRQSAEDLQRSNRDLEQFAYVASHDLQEPLRAVGGYVKLLQHRFPDKLDAKAREYVAGAFEGAARMERLIGDLLAFSRIGARGGNFAPADLETVLASALANLEVGLKSSRAAVTHEPLPTLSVDDTLIMQLFQNLIGNALKFHGEPPPRIHVGAQRAVGRWIFSVRDNGIGIEPQYYEKIFHIFQRLHTRKEYPGTGIGLAICKKIVERHGGAIWVESQPGQGSTFFFSIPAGPDSEAGAEAHSSESSSSSSSSS